MTELKTITIDRKIEIEKKIARKFERPIIFYMDHKEDKKSFLITFVILDFVNSKISFIFSRLPENELKLQSSPEKDKFFISKGYNPHCSIQINPEEDFLTFVECGKFFYYVNYKKNILRVYTENDLNLFEKDGLAEFGATFYKDPDDPKYFYFTALSGKKNDKSWLCFYRASLDLADLENILCVDTLSPVAPHVTKKHQKYLLSSDFGYRKFRNTKTGTVYIGGTEYASFVFEDMYREYCLEKGSEFSREEFLARNKIEESGIILESDFASFYKKKGNNFLGVCDNFEKYNFEALPGTITLLDLEEKKLKSFQTTFCTPAHFEIDPETGVIYASSHNFVSLDKIYFLGPAAIDKFVIKNGELEKIGTFCEEDAYRFTTHKIFKYENKKYICSFGQPNRLYFIDADSMKTLYYDDIEIDFLSDKEDIKLFLNGNDLEPFVMKTIEVSPDGEVLILIGHKYVYFYGFPERKILCKFDYRDFDLGKDFDLRDYNLRTTHCDYLK
jgi:hypothetical protein